MAVDESKLKRLARLLAPEATLYAVGGYPRDKLLGIECRDVDLCSPLSADMIKALLKGSEFIVADRSLRMGTLIISSEGFCAEYTVFRKDNYPEGSGVHRPVSVSFTADLRSDARRRDFKCNAIYYDVLNDSVIDPLGGCADVAAKIISTADAPDTVFGADGLRILRMVRFAAELGFSVEAQTYASALRNADKTRDIAFERIAAELDRILVADTAHPEMGATDGHKRGLEMLDDLGLIDAFLPELAALRGLEQPKKYHVYDAFRHSVEAYGAAPPSIRWAALLHDVGKKPALEARGNMHGHELMSEEIARRRLNALKFPKARTARICRLIAAHMVDVKGDMSEFKLKWFIASHADIMPELIELKEADGFASAGKPVGRSRLRKLYEEMLSDGTPMSLKELPVNGGDLIGLGIPECRRGEALGALWRESVLNPKLRDRERALEYIRKTAGESPGRKGEK